MADDKSLLATEAKPDSAIIKKLEEGKKGLLSNQSDYDYGEVESRVAFPFQNTRNLQKSKSLEDRQ